MGRGRRGLLGGIAALAVLAIGVLPDASAAPSVAPGSDPQRHLETIVGLSPAPEHRRFGSPGMAAAADYVAGVLDRAGYGVLRHDVPSTVHAVDYSPGQAPSLVRVADGLAWRTESAFEIEATTPPEGIACTVRRYDEVRPGDCGFVPYHQVSPEWNNFLGDVAGPVRTIRARGGVGAILQGDTDHHALIAFKVAQPIPTVVSLVGPDAILGQEVRMRVRGGEVPATMRNVIAVRPPTDPSNGYLLLQGHLDGWFAAAADNAGGVAAVLAAAERLAGDRSDRGLLLALYDAEEWGLRGSRAFVEDLARPDGLRIGDCGPVVRLEDVVAAVNLDVPSAIPSDAVGPIRDLTGVLVPLFSWRILVFSEEPVLAGLFATSMTASGVLGAVVTADLAEPINGGVSRSDTKWFHERGIPVAWPVVGYPEYHTEADDLDAVDPVDLRNVTSATVALIRSLDDAPIGRIGGAALPAPGSSGGDPRVSCEVLGATQDAGGGVADAVGAPGTTGVPTTATASASRATIPATGAEVALLPAALALLGWLVLLRCYSASS